MTVTLETPASETRAPLPGARMLRREASAVRILTRTMYVVAGVALISLVVSYAWFRVIPLDYWVQAGWHVAPFPLGSIQVTRSTS